MSPTPAPSGGEEFTEVVVVRHGETSWNASHIVQGQMDPELNEIGRQQAVVGGGESLNQLTERCVSYLNKIAQEHIGERVVVVSHGAAILEMSWHTDPPNSPIRRNIPNTLLNVFRVSSVTGHWILERCGDVSHLNGNGFLENSFGGNGASA
ncbi:hypothetical protein SETIT_7G315200v2 [Setaria italica]|uniref:Phosphoglycerate mutase (2,3-diphosphoglycerate-dependent) n=1 Tax=Setaria italica TaxID=4555 RepID=K3YAK0_SETIT|nr:hypothetical protein SETIT_7G315200v2 [Setaria italica]